MKLSKDKELITFKGKITEIDKLIEDRFNQFRMDSIFIDIESVVSIESIVMDGEVYMVETFIINKLNPEQYINKSIFKLLTHTAVGESICFNNIGYKASMSDATTIHDYCNPHDIAYKYNHLIDTVLDSMDEHIFNICSYIEIKKQIVEHLINVLKECA